VSGFENIDRNAGVIALINKPTFRTRPRFPKGTRDKKRQKASLVHAWQHAARDGERAVDAGGENALEFVQGASIDSEGTV
jgi:hypothetical protein